MSTAATLSPRPALLPRPRPRPRSLRFELGREEHLTQRIELDVRRRPDGRVDVRGACSPPDAYREVEVCADWDRVVVPVSVEGGFDLLGLSGTKPHVKVIFRGGPMPPVVFTKVPVAD